jgi:hypothetical protein
MYMEKDEGSQAKRKLKISRKVVMLICVFIVVSAFFVVSVLSSQTSGTPLVEEWKAVLDRILNSLNNINDSHVIILQEGSI